MYLYCHIRGAFKETKFVVVKTTLHVASKYSLDMVVLNEVSSVGRLTLTHPHRSASSDLC